MKARDLLKAAREQGWRIEEKSSGYMLFPPDPGKSAVTLHESCVTAGSRSLPNLLSDLRRSGLIIPGEEQQRRSAPPMKVNEIAKLARQQGWCVEDHNGGYKLYPADTTHSVVTIGAHMDDSSSGRHYQNLLSQLRQAGLELPGEKDTRKLQSERQAAMPQGTAPDPLAALQEELQVEEEIEITRIRHAKIWVPTLQKLLETYLKSQMPLQGDSIYEINLVLDAEGSSPVNIEKLSYVDVKTITVERQAQGTNRSA